MCSDDKNQWLYLRLWPTKLQNFLIFDLAITWVSMDSFVGCYYKPWIILISFNSLFDLPSVHWAPIVVPGIRCSKLVKCVIEVWDYFLRVWKWEVPIFYILHDLVLTCVYVQTHLHLTHSKVFQFIRKS